MDSEKQPGRFLEQAGRLFPRRREPRSRDWHPPPTGAILVAMSDLQLRSTSTAATPPAISPSPRWE